MSPRRMVLAALGGAVLAFGGCAQSPPQVAAHHPKEYFPSSVYGAASRRVIADGEPVPHGGGQYLVGRPYTIAGQTYYPSERKITQVGLASWYGDAFHGRLTANGEVYDRDGFTAAHPTMPLPSYARVTNLRNHYSMIVRVNDRGPYHSDRVMDVSRRVAETLDFQRGGTSLVKVEYVGRASLAGSDDSKLYATLRTDRPARLHGYEDENTAVAEAAPPVRVASLAPYVPRVDKRLSDVAETGSLPKPRGAGEPDEAAGQGRHAPKPARDAAAEDRDAPARPPSHADRGRKEPPHLLAAAVPHPTHGTARDVARAAPHQPEAMPPRRPAGAVVAKAGHPVPKAAAAIARPPARPVQMASVAAGNRHAAHGMRLTRPRDD